MLKLVKQCKYGHVFNCINLCIIACSCSWCEQVTFEVWPVFECLTLWNWKAWHSCDQYLSFKSVFSLVCVLFAGLHQNWSESKGSSCWTLNKRKRTSMLRQVGYYGRIRRMGQMQMGIDCWWFAVSSCSALCLFMTVCLCHGFSNWVPGTLREPQGDTRESTKMLMSKSNICT